MSSEPVLQGFDQQAFRASYSAFLGERAASGRLLLTGHSHQAWPDVARAATLQAFDDAARYVDDKWEQVVFPLVDQVGRAVLERLGFAADDAIAFAPNTHELVYRVLSALPRGAKVIATDSEFHSAHRQLSRLAEQELDVHWIHASPREALTGRLQAALADGADLLLLSAVFFEDSYIVNKLDEIIEQATQRGTWVLVDAYHAFNVAPLRWPTDRSRLFVTAGGYKYAAMGEGVCFLRVPPHCDLRPRQTGWFADFEALGSERSVRVGYGAGGARFWGATFDATPFYRARAVLSLFDQHALDVPRLRAISIHQTSVLDAQLRAVGASMASAGEPARRAGFVAVRTEQAGQAAKQLRQRDIFVDARGDLLRLGPAPYVEDSELLRGVAAVAEVLGLG